MKSLNKTLIRKLFKVILNILEVSLKLLLIDFLLIVVFLIHCTFHYISIYT